MSTNFGNSHKLFVVFFKMAFNLKTSKVRLNVPKLSWTPVLHVSAYIEKIPNCKSKRSDANMQMEA